MGGGGRRNGQLVLEVNVREGRREKEESGGTLRGPRSPRRGREKWRAELWGEGRTGERPGARLKQGEAPGITCSPPLSHRGGGGVPLPFPPGRGWGDARWGSLEGK